jgi:ribosomal protein S15P/S13E
VIDDEAAVVQVRSWTTAIRQARTRLREHPGDRACRRAVAVLVSQRAAALAHLRAKLAPRRYQLLLRELRAPRL